MKKRVLSMLLVIAMVLCMLPTVFAASSGTCGDNVTWRLEDNGTLTISGSGAMYDYVYPDTSPFCESQEIRSVVIQSGVTTIGGSAFDSCTNLTNVTIPDGVTTIGDYAFYGCSSLTTVNFGYGLTTIGRAAFNRCSSLASLDLKFGVTTIGEYAFSGCKKLSGTLVIPLSVTTIERLAFDGCTGLTGLDLGNGVTTMGDYAFTGCTGLTSVTIPNSVTSIGSSAFYPCSGLREITFQGDAPSFGNTVFYGVTATAYYPIGNSTWTKSVRDKCTGNLTWVLTGDAKSLEIDVLPRVNYSVGEELDLSSLRVMANSFNGDRGEVPIDNLTVSPCDMSTTGRKTVTLSYKDLSVSFDVFVHAGHTEKELDRTSYPESRHPYSPDTDETQIVSYEGADMLILKFSPSTEVESGCDYIYVYDGNDNLVAQYTGTEAVGVTLSVPGDTAKVRLTSDSIFCYSGYYFESITAVNLTHNQKFVNEVAPTCTEPGYTSATVCDICSKVFSAQGTIPAKGHTGVPVCSVCGEEWVSAGDIDMDGSVTVTDMLKLKPLILANKWTNNELALGDLDNDGKLSVKDIMLIKSMILDQ